ncbi:rhomboid family intramembrane serine protease [Leucobacter coleopterorum]|uniref:Rhomboid family intramembrane serine protease n=1 Tax=Leucobacter coleopterorum TaxID=2714933 RepID=A0ABX6JVA8_9MICO|nr:rhomboid family intramembrane serine protease [Leucobacter coleopterorum]QIM17513.1 rhomboid family intramembrane serine protease [Leucobacter coleopterorum]
MAANGSTPAFGERASYGPNDVCYRHPGVHSFTLCQRCGRTICPECQIASPVGVLCPECVKQTQPGVAQRSSRKVRVAGRRIAALDTPVTYGIMALCALVFIVQSLSHYFGADEVTLALWYAPLYSLPGDIGPGFEPWRMFTVMFTHSTGTLLHILFNMLALWMFGRNLEQMIGHMQFLVLYLFAGIGGSLGSMFWAYVDPSTLTTPTVGASGAIFGVLGATLVAYKAANVNITSLAVLIAINIGIGFLPGVGVAWQAHLGGMLVGALTMWLMLGVRGPRKKTQRILTLTSLGVILVALACSYLVVLPNVFG